MPIASRTLEHVRPHGTGVWVQERLVDDTPGRGDWLHQYVIGSEAEAQTAMDARVMTTQLEDQEERDAVAFIRAGGDPGSFSKTDLSDVQFNRRLAKRFARARFDLDPDFVRNVADWVSGFTVVQIAGALAITEAKAQIILDRANHIKNTIDPALVTDDGRVQEDVG